MSNLIDVSGNVSYAEVNAMIRLGQRLELEAFLRRWVADLRAVGESDLELARSRFIALVSALVVTTLEIGAPADVERQISRASAVALESPDAESLCALATDYFRHLCVCAKPNVNRFALRLIEDAKSILVQRYAEPLSVEEVARCVGLSSSHFRYLFKEVTGVPFKQYLTRLRLEAGRQLLETSHLSVKQIAYRVGYRDVTSFSRSFYALYGLSPKAHRVASV
jgi:AraC-like DNA-binding protein